ncbi:NADH dehydrogenase type II [Gluconobacter morbifer G707]|uniref:NADH dehydrogenase type II n=1 Tax=Gluconobacter morbifer G707 TaxID=1088869 RepID=G6XFV1_9PROT|nr:NADH dehydrogenase type II [Gluconobacter morbifer G707]
MLVLGGGVGGLEAAMALGRKSNISLTLIDRSPVHYWKPALHEFASGTMEHTGNCIPFAETASRFGFRFVQSAPVAVNRDNKTVSLENGETLPYDYLVVALGARANDFGIPGIIDHCLFIDSLNDASIIFERFRTALIAARTAGTKLSVGIVGGGATGVQLVAEMCKAIDGARGLGPAIRKSLLQAVLIETGPRILPAFPEAVSTAATQELEKLGITVMTGAMVVGADDTGFNLKSGEHIPATLRIWAAGVRASDATGLFEGLERGRAGQLAVTQTLQTTADPHIFAIGDCSRIDTAPVAPTAQAARQEGQYVGAVLPEIIAGRVPANFNYNDRGAVVALGDYNGWGMLDANRSFGGGALSGLFARLIHEGLYRQHQAGVVGLGKTAYTTAREHISPARPDLGA